MKVAIVGAGVAGLTAASRLHPEHDITVFEAAGYAGGHTNTIRVERPDGTWNVDTGFIVLNDRNYPRFRALLRDHDVAVQPTRMGFSVSAESEDFEYAGTPRGLLCQPRNLLRPAFARMVADLVRFNGSMRALLASNEPGPSLAEYLRDGAYSRWFVERLIVPQACAVWSADPAAMWDFPVRYMAEFFANHGMLGFRDRPQWMTVVGGSARYVEALTTAFAPRIRTHTPVQSVTRHETHVEVTAAGAEPEAFEEVVLACHADQALAMLTDPSDAEGEILGAFPFQVNEAVLHTDARLLPRRAAARQAWNYHLLEQPKPLPTVTYSMNRLQRLAAPVEFCVTLNLTERIDPTTVIRTIPYAHPVFTDAGVRAQGRHGEINGVNRTRYCGAYWHWGFHEDGVVSAFEAVDGLRSAAAVAA